MYQKKGLYMPYAKMMKEVVDVPVLCAGRMDDPDRAVGALQDGVCDLISLGRPLLADPYYVNKLRAGQKGYIRPCISCQEGCMGRIQEYSMINCAVNPQAGRERANDYRPVLHPKKVLVAGGGPAGLEAARVLAQRGHIPHLYERTDHLGGNLAAAGIPSFKEDDLALIRWYEQEMDRLNVSVHLNSPVSREEVLSGNYDAVIVATGSTPKTFSLGDGAPVFTATDILLGKAPCGQKAVVIGGGLVGCETALWLAQLGRQVTIVETLDRLMSVNRPLCHANSEMLERLLPFHHVNILTSSRAIRYHDGHLELSIPGDRLSVVCDTVILAVGFQSEQGLYRELLGQVPELYLLGDARKVSNIMYAVWDAFEVANHI